MYLDATNKSITVKLDAAVETNQLAIIAHYSDYGSLTPAVNSILYTNGMTPVTIVPAPGTSIIRLVQQISIHNRDTVSAIVTVIVMVAASEYICRRKTLLPGESLVYSRGIWYEPAVAGGGGGMSPHGNEYHTSVFITLPTVKADTDISSAISLKHSNSLDHSHSNKSLLDSYDQSNADLSDAVSKKHAQAHTHPESDVTNLVTDLSGKEPANANIQTHVTSAHAPSNAQKNSDITKEEIEAKLTGVISSHSHSGGGGGDNSPLRYRLSGRYHTMFPDSNGTLALTINRLYAIPIMIVDAKTITRIAIHVTTLGTSASARLGIYQDNGSLYPGNLISDCGVVSMTSTGIKEITGLNVSLAANTLYWLVCDCNVAATIAAFAVVYQNALLGYPTTALNTVGFSSYYVAFTYAALPATYPGSATLNNAAAPKIAVYW